MSKPIQTIEELDAVLHWRGKHTQAIRKLDALQQLLNQRDEQVETLKLQRQGEAAACAHEWTDDGEFTLTCTKCGKTENNEPYGWVQTRGNAINHFTQEWDVVESWEDQGFEYKAMYEQAEQPAPIAVVPDGYCIMPRQLTAENGAKAMLLGEFKLLATMECPECCELDEPTEGCSICDGEGEYGQKHTIPWDQIKFIYRKAVAGLALKAESAKSR